MFEIFWADTAKQDLHSLAANASKKKQYQAVIKAIRQIAEDPRYPGLRSHPYQSLTGPNGEKVFESYAENDTPGAYRIFWYYGLTKSTIWIFLITPHP